MTKTEQKTDAPPAKSHEFTADVSRLLNIVANALYTNHDVFLRELISNAADACDRLRYDAIATPKFTEDNSNFRIHIYKDTDFRTLTVVDNGTGMGKHELIDHLGTIAKSGTAALMEQMKEAQKDKTAEKDPLKLIGQFGVGFYASYMVADFVTVISRKAGTNETWAWESDGASGFNIREATSDETAKLDGKRGTAIILNIKDEGSEFLIDQKIKDTVETYSDHIDVKIFLNEPEKTNSGEGEPINKAQAIWTRSKQDVTTEQYTEFYKHITHGFDEPVLTSHWRAEGKIEFSALTFIPTMRPWDLYDPTRRDAVRLYVRRVFISDNVEGLMYPWMRFVRGVIDSEDLPLNISRESLQYNPIIGKIRTAVTKRILSDLDKLSRDDWPGFITFWGQFGAAIKEGLYDAADHREAIFKICRFYSTHDNGDKYTSLKQYVERMGDDQKEIYYLSGENLEALKNSPQLEGFKAKGIEVLFFTDTIDDFWLQNAMDYDEKPFKSVTKGDIDLDGEQQNDKKDEQAEKHKDFIEALNETLDDDVSEVRISNRLTDSPVCLIAADNGVDMHMERMLKLQQKYAGETRPVLEVNINHALIKKLEKLGKDDKRFKDAAALLFDQAKIIQGEPVKNPSDFARRMADFMNMGLD